MLKLLQWLFAACVLLAAPALCAHEFWMLPGSFHVPVGQAAPLSLAVGENFAGEPLAFSPALVARLRQITAQGSTELPTRTLPGATSPHIALQLARAGTHLVALDTHPSFIELEAGKFNDYLRLEGLQAVLLAREQAGLAGTPGRERYRRNVKTLVEAGGRSDETFARRTGQRLEIVPGADPFRITAPAPLSFRVLFDGRPLPKALLKVWQRGAGGVTALQAVTDARGAATLALPATGTWMASVVHMVPVRDTPGVDWDSYWGNLTFSLGRPEGSQQSNTPRR